MYDEVSKVRKTELKPRHQYAGELLQYVLVRHEETYFLETKNRYITTSIEKDTHLSIIHIYYNGKRITGKRIRSDKPALQESMSLIDWLIIKIKFGEIL